MAEQRLVAAGHMLPSSTPHSPSSKGHLSEPESPTDVAAAVRPKSGAPKHNSSAVMYYRQRQQQAGSQQQLPRTGSLHDAESVGDLITAAHDLDSSSLTAQLHDLHQQQQQALLSGHPGQIRVPAEGSSPSIRNAMANSSGEVHGPSVCANIESIQNVLTALFVASMGLIMSPVFLWHHATVLLWGTLVVTLLKAAVVTLVVRMFDVPLRLSLAVGLSMAHIGEFSFVLLSMASQLKLLSAQVGLLLGAQKQLWVLCCSGLRALSPGCSFGWQECAHGLLLGFYCYTSAMRSGGACFGMRQNLVLAKCAEENSRKRNYGQGFRVSTMCVLLVQVYMLLLGVTAMSLLTTPAVIMASIHFLAKDGHQQVFITGGCDSPQGRICLFVRHKECFLAAFLRESV
jgi:hypothetical protein